MEQPPPATPPSGNPPPTDPTRRVVMTPAADAVYETELAERADRTRFWAYFGAAAAVLAAILGVIALIVALQAKDDADSNDGSAAGLQRQVSTLQDDVTSLKSQTSSANATKQQL